jgi:hypothetical protein
MRLAPVGANVDPSRILAMESLAVAELRGIVEAAQQQIIRVGTQAMFASYSPTKTANALSGVIRNMRNRTRAMSADIIVRTHATATLSAYRAASITHVGTIPEHSAHGLVLQKSQSGIRFQDADLPSIHLPLKTLIARARKFWRARYALAGRFGVQRAITRALRFGQATPGGQGG